jgi:hypothetical protein
VRQIDTSTWECTACGTRMTVPSGARPIAMLLTVPGRPRERVVTIRDAVLHRCTFTDAPEDGRPPPVGDPR